MSAASQEYRNGASQAAMELADRLCTIEGLIGRITPQIVMQAAEVLANEKGGER